jgi:hypothetical protein
LKNQVLEHQFGDLLYVPLFLTESLLPYRGTHQSFTRAYQNTDITIQGGADRTGLIPLPTGIIGRRLLLHFITQSWLEGSPEIKIRGASTLLTQFGIKHSHANKKNLKRQLYSLSMMMIRVRSHSTFDKADTEPFKVSNIRLMDSLNIYGIDEAPNQMCLFDSTVSFSPEFFDLLCELRQNHPPILRGALYGLTGPLQMDIYCFLQRRLQNENLMLKYGGQKLSWDNLYQQFGRGERRQDFQKMFRAALSKVLPALKTKSVRFADNQPVRVLKDGIVLNSIPRQVNPVLHVPNK